LEGESAPAYHDVAPLLSELPSELHAALLAASHGLLHLPSVEHVAPDEGTATEGSEPEGTPRMNGPVALDTEPQDEAVEPAGPPGVETDPDEPEPAEVEHEPVEAAEDEHEPVEAEYEPVAGEQEEAAYPSLDEPTFAEEPAWGTHEADEAALTQDLELGSRDERGHDPQEDVETDDRWGVDMGGEQDLETWGEPDTEDRQEDVAADPPGFEVPQEAEPVAEPAPETAADTSPPQEEAAPAAPQETRSEKWSNLAMVLVVDDDPSIRDLLQVVLDPHKGLFMPWGSGIVLVREAGGFVTDLAGEADVLGRGSIVAANDLIALGCYDTLTARNITCPDGMSITGYNDAPFVDMVSPPLTTVRIRQREMGIEAARVLLARMNGQDIAGSPFPSSVRPQVHLNGTRAVLRHAGGGTINPGADRTCSCAGRGPRASAGT
jgi:hypothetical protein